MIKLTHSSCLVWMEPQLEGNRFEWDAIVSVYKQEYERSKEISQMILKICEIYVLQDSATKLNVLLARIMQEYELCVVW